MNKIYVAISMDCEPPNTLTHPEASGPPDFERSELYIRYYTEIASGYGFPVSFFIHPEVATHQAKLFEELEGKGACLGLHLHPWKFSKERNSSHLGLLSESQQRAVISEAVAVWQLAFRKRPKYFRPGTFSANDATFQVLVDLGFEGGSVSIPGRVWRDLGAVWAGAVPDPHRPHPWFRQLPGTLDFANIPMSVDASELQVAGQRKNYLDLRPDYKKADYAMIARNIVGQIVERDPAVPIITLVTHNDNDYSNPQDSARNNYETALREIRSACSEYGLEAAGTTVDRICQAVLDEPVAPTEFVYV